MSNYRHGTNYYEILEVARDAAQNEIHKAYQRAKATYSQDNPALYSMFSKEEARELVRMIEEAYAVLGNQTLRTSYDQTLVADAGKQHQPQSTQEKSQQTGQKSAPVASSQSQKSDHSQPIGNPTEAGTVAEGYKVRMKENTSAASGTGKTPVSTYKIDEEMEADIANRVEWDGPSLQKIRTYKNVSLDQVSEASRVSRTYLMAVETNDYKALPAAVFVRGFVIQMARILGLDENKVAGSYMKIFKEKNPSK